MNVFRFTQLAIILALFLSPALSNAENTSLIVEYLFDDFSDSSGNGFDGLPGSGATLSSGVLLLDGSENGFVEIPFPGQTPFSGLTDWTVEMDFLTGDTGVLFSSDNSAASGGVDPGDEAGALNVFIFEGGQIKSDFWWVGSVNSPPPRTFNDSLMHHLKLEYDASTQLYTQTIDDIIMSSMSTSPEDTQTGRDVIKNTLHDQVLIGHSFNQDPFFEGFDFPNGLFGSVDNFRITGIIIPEPSTLTLATLTLLTLLAHGWRRRRAS